MYYYLNYQNINKFKKRKKYISMITLEQLKNIQASLNLSNNIIKFFSNTKNLFEIRNDYNLSIISVKAIQDEYVKIGLYISTNLILIIIINTNINIPDIYSIKDLKEFINTIIDNTIYSYYYDLENIENKIIEIEKELIEGNKVINISNKLFTLKRYISSLKSNNENNLFFIENLKNLNCNILNKNNYNYIKNLEFKLNRLIHNYEYFIENTIQLHDIYQSNIDYMQNKTIKSLTIISSIFLPLSLITGWYGMNFKYIPELNYKYSYIILIFTSITIILVIIIVLKKKKII